MKRICLLAVCLTAMATAQAQFVSMYSEVYNEKTGELQSKEWVSTEGHTRMEYPDGKITIFRLDSMMIYNLDPVKKTASAISFSQFGNPNKVAGRVVQTNHSEKRELIERGVDVEGYSCDHYTVTITNTRPDGSQEGGVEHMWEHEPLKTWIRYGSGQFLHGETSIRRNIRQGAQPMSLFAIPKDYTVSQIPAGGLMEMMTGKPQTEEQKKQTFGTNDLLDMVTGGNKEAAAKMNETQQKMQEAMKNSENQNKKK